MGMDAMAKMTRRIRGLSMASSLAMCAALLAAPVAADDGSTTEADTSAEHAPSPLPASEEQNPLDDWSRILGEIDGPSQGEPPSDTEPVDLERPSGVTPSGVEWTRVIVSDLSGVEWTRLRATDPDGSSWVETSMVDPSGVEWTCLIYTGADGSSWVEWRYLDADGNAWSHRARADDLDGVEWT